MDSLELLINDLIKEEDDIKKIINKTQVYLKKNNIEEKIYNYKKINSEIDILNNLNKYNIKENNNDNYDNDLNIINNEILNKNNYFINIKNKIDLLIDVDFNKYFFKDDYKIEEYNKENNLIKLQQNLNLYKIYNIVLFSKDKSLEIINKINNDDDKYNKYNKEELIGLNIIENFINGIIDIETIKEIKNTVLIYPILKIQKNNINRIVNILKYKNPQDIFNELIDDNYYKYFINSYIFNDNNNLQLDKYFGNGNNINNNNLQLDKYFGNGIINNNDKLTLNELQNNYSNLIFYINEHIILLNKINKFKNDLLFSIKIENKLLFLIYYSLIYIANNFKEFINVPFIINGNYIKIESLYNFNLIEIKNKILKDDKLKERIDINILNINNDKNKFINIKDSQSKIIYILIFFYMINNKQN